MICKIRDLCYSPSRKSHFIVPLLWKMHNFKVFCPKTPFILSGPIFLPKVSNKPNCFVAPIWGSFLVDFKSSVNVSRDFCISFLQEHFADYRFFEVHHFIWLIKRFQESVKNVKDKNVNFWRGRDVKNQ